MGGTLACVDARKRKELKMKSLVVIAILVLAASSAGAVDRGRNIKGGFTGDCKRLTAEQKMSGSCSTFNPRSSTKKAKK
jgi:hypothetical protein